MRLYKNFNYSMNCRRAVCLSVFLSLFSSLCLTGCVCLLGYILSGSAAADSMERLSGSTAEGLMVCLSGFAAVDLIG